jgi:hypothetical protein
VPIFANNNDKPLTNDLNNKNAKGNEDTSGGMIGTFLVIRYLQQKKVTVH